MNWLEEYEAQQELAHEHIRPRRGISTQEKEQASEHWGFTIEPDLLYKQQWYSINKKNKKGKSVWYAGFSKVRSCHYWIEWFVERQEWHELWFKNTIQNGPGSGPLKKSK